MSQILDPSVTFHELSNQIGLDYRLKKAIVRLGYVRPTLVQSKCLPLGILRKRDLLVRAKTGSGKTLAYCLPLIQKLLDDKTTTIENGGDGNEINSISAIVLVPTRELCSQVTKVIQGLTYYCNEIVSVVPLTTTTVYGGVLASKTTGQKSDRKQKEAFIRQEAMLRDHPNIIVATPGGLLAHIRSNSTAIRLNLKSSVQTLVIDEADLVLSFGYNDDIIEIVKALPKIYQGFLMSATISPEIESLKKFVLHSPVVLKLEHDKEDGGPNSNLLKQYYLNVPKKDKPLVIFVFLKLGLLKGKGMFFVNSIDNGYRLKLFLEQFSIRSTVLNSELPYRSRLNIIEQFNVGNFDYLIATDDDENDNYDEEDDEDENSNDEDDDDEADDENEKKKKKKRNKSKKPFGKRKDKEYGAARGLDFFNVSFVINVDMPYTTKAYSHRVGRTARGGRTGVALSLVETESRQQNELLLDIQEDQPQILLNEGPGKYDKNRKFRNRNNNNHEVLEQYEQKPIQEDGQSGDFDGDHESDQPKYYEKQPSLLNFDLQEIEGFRYRVDDVGRAVTKIAVKETRMNEIRNEILNSERLASHFDANPRDLQLLRHDGIATHVSKVQEHLKHVPKYLLPRGMQVAKVKRRRKKKTKSRQQQQHLDPLRSYDTTSGSKGNNNEEDDLLDGIADDGGNDDDEFQEYYDDDSDDNDNSSNKKKKLKSTDSRIFSNKNDARTGKSTAGRQSWKEKHKKGKFSNKKRKSDRKKTEPLGL